MHCIPRAAIKSCSLQGHSTLRFQVLVVEVRWYFQQSVGPTVRPSYQLHRAITGADLRQSNPSSEDLRFLTLGCSTALFDGSAGSVVFTDLKTRVPIVLHRTKERWVNSYLLLEGLTLST
eukprot:SAG31_NODE_850_length_11521_cov_47.558396_13_plen_120_part_00